MRLIGSGSVPGAKRPGPVRFRVQSDRVQLSAGHKKSESGRVRVQKVVPVRDGIGSVQGPNRTEPNRSVRFGSVSKFFFSVRFGSVRKRIFSVRFGLNFEKREPIPSLV